MSFKVVVARYNESVEWLNDISDNCIIYNKGPLELPNAIALENVGRESHTHLYYIINHYDDLPDVVVFTQGNIADHRPPGESSYLLKLKDEALTNGKCNPYGNYFSSSKNNCCWDPEFNKKGDEYMLTDSYKNNHHQTFLEWYIKHVSVFYPNPMKLYCSGVFAVKRELILLNTKEYYQSLLEECNHHVNPVEGHFFERSWYYIFSNRNVPP